MIRSHLHDVYTEEINKVPLSTEDDKRVIMKDGIHTKAYGHYSLKTEGGRGARTEEGSIGEIPNGISVY